MSSFHSLSEGQARKMNFLWPIRKQIFILLIASGGLRGRFAGITEKLHVMSAVLTAAKLKMSPFLPPGDRNVSIHLRQLV